MDNPTSSDRDNAAAAGDLPHAMAGVSIEEPGDAAAAEASSCYYRSDWVAVRRTETAGMGVFAIRDIPRGTRIAAEAPLIMIPPGADAESATRFCEAMLRTSEDALARLDRHHCDPLTLETVRNTDIGDEILQWTKTHLPSPTSPRKSPEEIAEQACRRYAIFLTNNLDTGGAEPEPLPVPVPVPVPESELAGSEQPPTPMPLEPQDRSGGRGMFHLFSRMNHSCAPNLFDHYNTSLGSDSDSDFDFDSDGERGKDKEEEKKKKTKGRLTCHAARDVAAGEQLYSHYIDLLLPRRRRRRKLLRGWGFVCDCVVCVDDELEKERERALELDDTIQEFFDYCETKRQKKQKRDLNKGNGNEPPVLVVAAAAAAADEKAANKEGEGDGNEEEEERGGGDREKQDKVEEEEEEEEGEEGKPVLKTPSEALEASRELVGLLRRQGLYGLELFNAYRFCSKFSLELGDIAKALEYAYLAQDVERCCVGLDATLADDVWGDTGEWIESTKEEKQT